MRWHYQNLMIPVTTCPLRLLAAPGTTWHCSGPLSCWRLQTGGEVLGGMHCGSYGSIPPVALGRPWLWALCLASPSLVDVLRADFDRGTQMVVS